MTHRMSFSIGESSVGRLCHEALSGSPSTVLRLPTRESCKTQGAEDHRRTQGREVHPGTQGWLRSCQDARPASRGKILTASLLTQASHLRWPVALRAASSDFVGQTKTIEKERCGEVRCAHERIEREETSKIGDETYAATCISLISR